MGGTGEGRERGKALEISRQGGYKQALGPERPGLNGRGQQKPLYLENLAAGTAGNSVYIHYTIWGNVALQRVKYGAMDEVRDFIYGLL